MKKQLIPLLVTCLLCLFGFGILSACTVALQTPNTDSEISQIDAPGQNTSDEAKREEQASNPNGVAEKSDPTDTGDTSGPDRTEPIDSTTDASDTDFPHGSGSLTPPEETEKSMPILSIRTNGTRISTTDAYTDCTVSLSASNAVYDIDCADAGIRVRGNSTAGASKKPYRIHFDQKINLLGLNQGAKCKNWVLMADYFDHSLMRTETAFRLAETILDGWVYSSDCIHVEVYINGNYNGVYLLCEQTQINQNRVAITEKADDYTGLDIGYLLVGQGGRNNEDNTVSFPNAKAVITDVYGTAMEAGIGYFSLASGDYTDEQIQYISQYVSAVYRITYEAIVNHRYYKLNPSTLSTELITDFPKGMSNRDKQKDTVSRVMDIESAVRMYMLDEVVKDLDSSTFNMYVDMGADGNGKLTFAAPWDFDFALGNTKWESLRSPYGLYACSFLVSDGIRQNSWYVMLYQADWFRDAVKERWAEVYPTLLADAEEIRKEADRYQSAFNRNYECWNTMGKITMEHHQNRDVLLFTSHHDAAEHLYRWLSTRLQWLNTVWGNGTETTEHLSHSFLMADGYADAFINYKRCTGRQSADAFILQVAGDHDPYVTFAVEKLASLDADTYTTLQITYRIPANSALDSYNSEVFLMAGTVLEPTGGISVTFSAIADGKTHTATLDLSAVASWHGQIHGIRLDFFPTADYPDDQFELLEIRFEGTVRSFAP